MLFPAVRHELSFWHGGSRLAGDLVLPAGPGPHPVVIIVGEPSVTQRDRSAWLDGLAAAGIACFTWDRAGTSPVAHDPVRQAAEHAREVLAALKRLRCQPELDAAAVALLGWGEGGWAAAQAATFSSQIRALVLAGTPTAPPAQLVEHRVVQQLRAAGHAGSEVLAARAAVRRRLADLDQGSGPVLDVGDDSSDEPEGAGGAAARLGLDVLAGTTQADLAADPLPTLSAVSIPVLALFGEQDPTLPLEESVRGVHAALRAAGHVDHRVAVVRGGDHALRIRAGHGLGVMSGGRHQFGEWPVALTSVIVEWLDARIRAVADVPGFAPPHAPTGGAGAGGAGGAGAGGGRRADRDDQLAGGVHPGPLPVRQVRRRISR